MGVISFRLPDDLQKELEAADVRIGETARARLTELALRMRAKRVMATLEKYRREAPTPVADMVRGVREEH